MKSLILLLVLASAVAGPVDIQKRIFNGGPCSNNEGQHYVILTTVNNDVNTRFCGGNLISPDWVLTAAHCDKGWFYVILGAHATGHPAQMEITPRDTRHFFYANRHHDIMLIRLPQPAQGLPIIALPGIVDVNPPGTAVTCPPLPDIDYTIMGWSFIDPAHQNLPNQLQCGTIRLHQACTGRNLNIGIPAPGHQWIGQHMLCSIEPGGAQGCQGCPGDSGGSLVFVDTVNGVRVPYLIGMIVGGDVPPSGVTHYMDVCAYREWISLVTGI